MEAGRAPVVANGRVRESRSESREVKEAFYCQLEEHNFLIEKYVSFNRPIPLHAGGRVADGMNVERVTAISVRVRYGFPEVTMV